MVDIRRVRVGASLPAKEIEPRRSPKRTDGESDQESQDEKERHLPPDLPGVVIVVRLI